MSPNTAEEWLAVANQRLADAISIYKHQSNSIGSVYMAGYAIECSLKALLQKRGIPYPKSGPEGHNLKGLWEKSTIKFADIHDTKGAQTFFFAQWNTHLRYETELPRDLGLKEEELIEGAKKLQGLIQTKIRRSKPRPPK
jgi:hypothetical protein